MGTFLLPLLLFLRSYLLVWIALACLWISGQLLQLVFCYLQFVGQRRQALLVLTDLSLQLLFLGVQLGDQRMGIQFSLPAGAGFIAQAVLSDLQLTGQHLKTLLKLITLLL